MSSPDLWVAWFTAAATILAALVPATLWFVERRDRRTAEAKLESREQQDRLQELERQARQVFVWRGSNDEEYFLGASPYPSGVHMHNGSDLPIFDVVVMGSAKPDGDSDLDGLDDFQEMVLPKSGFAAPSFSQVREPVKVRFRDARGTIWVRDSRGGLAQGQVSTDAGQER